MEQAKIATCLAWIDCLQKGKSPIDVWEKNKIKNVIVYGIADLGELLVKEIIKKKYEIVGITDRLVNSGNYDYYGIPVIPRKKISEVTYRDCYIVVTSMVSYNEIRMQLQQEGVKNVISLLELLKEIDNENDSSWQQGHA